MSLARSSSPTIAVTSSMWLALAARGRMDGRHRPICHSARRAPSGVSADSGQHNSTVTDSAYTKLRTFSGSQGRAPPRRDGRESALCSSVSSPSAPRGSPAGHTLWAPPLEPDHPATQRLTVYTANRRGLLARGAIEHRRNHQKPTRALVINQTRLDSRLSFGFGVD